MTGIAGLDVLNEFEAFFKEKLHGVTVKKIWEEKSIGFARSGYDVVFLGLDGEDPQIYSLQHEDAEGNPAWDWLHTVSFYIDIRTGKSEERVLELVDDIMNLLKSNVVPVHKSTNMNVQLLPTGVTSLNEDYRNLFRYMIDCEIMVFNP